DRVLGLPGVPHLAHGDDVEGGAERRGDLRGGDDAAAREPDDDRVRPALGGQVACQQAAGVAPVLEQRHVGGGLGHTVMMPRRLRRASGPRSHHVCGKPAGSVSAATDVAAVRPPDDRGMHELAPEQLRRRVDPAQLPFETTAELEPLVGTVGQPRAIDAIDFGLQVETPGYNLYVAGLPGSGRATTVRDYVDRLAAARPAPDDWVYVHNFADGDRPQAIRLPAGRGPALARDLDEFVQAARREIPRAFESEDYERRQREVVAELSRRREALTEELVELGRARGFVLQVTPVGVVSTPIHAGQPLTPEAFAALPAEERQRIESASKEIGERTAAFLRQVRQLEKEALERVRQLECEVALFAIGPLLHDLRERYAGEQAVLDHLAAVEADVVAHLDEFRQPEEAPLPPPFGPARR